MAQLNFPRSENRFICVTYQSNEYLNEELNNNVKPLIAKIIIDSIPIENIYSYIHGQIIVEVKMEGVVSALTKLHNELKTPLANHTPKLLFCVNIVSFQKGVQPLKNLIYVEGSDEMNANFLESIKDIWNK